MSGPESHHIFIFKAPSEEETVDPYVKEIQKLNVTCTCAVIPVLHFEFYNLEDLNDKLCCPGLYSGIVFASPRCVKAVAKCGKLGPEWKSLFAFAVGEATGRLVQEKLGLNVEGTESGNGALLAKLILQKEIKRPLLIPCGNLAKDTIVQALKDEGLNADSIEVYRTLPHPQLERLIRNSVEERRPDFVVYFSPSGVDSTLDIIKKYCSHYFDSIQWIAIGPTTKEHLLKSGLTVCCTAAKPTPHHLAQAVILATQIPS